ncbi:uncharacterized protein LOC131931168 [Physella acuta]|uniref:uncharacterized protein LOC131931168 n=1 Tax=Physella acuta TaxID=109671 RepID=UPI0027DADBF0|nr:uncharacterized protein LOC131931168 [Physella acuta]
MKSCVYQLVCAVCVLMSGLTQTSADFSTERRRVSEACSKSLDACITLSNNPAPFNDAGWCTLASSTINGVSAYQCVVKIGLCTDEEFVALKNGACGQTATVQTWSSAFKTSVNNVVKSTSSTCQRQIVDCIFKSNVATVLKQQEQYCKLMNLVVTGKTTRECLTPDCTSNEILNLNTIACSTSQSQPFSDAIVATSQMCQDQLDSCTHNFFVASAFIQGEKYCDALSLAVVLDCMNKEGCTEKEFSKLKATCSGSHGVASVIMLVLTALLKLF